MMNREYLELANPISADKTVMRQEILASMLEVVEKNFRSRDRIALFEIGPVFLPEDVELNILEVPKLALCLFGPVHILPGRKLRTRLWIILTSRVSLKD